MSLSCCGRWTLRRSSWLVKRRSIILLIRIILASSAIFDAIAWVSAMKWNLLLLSLACMASFVKGKLINQLSLKQKAHAFIFTTCVLKTFVYWVRLHWLSRVFLNVSVSNMSVLQQFYSNSMFMLYYEIILIDLLWRQTVYRSLTKTGFIVLC